MSVGAAFIRANNFINKKLKQNEIEIKTTAEVNHSVGIPFLIFVSITMTIKFGIV